MKNASITVFEVISKDLQGKANTSFHIDQELNKFFSSIGASWKRKPESEPLQSKIAQPLQIPMSIFGF